MLSFKEKLKKEPIWFWLLLALFIRLLFMPFTAHSDLLSVYGRAYLILKDGKLGFFGLDMMNLLHAGFLLLLRPLFAYKTLFNNYNLLTFTENDWLGFISQPGIFRALFFFKLPYLIFDLLVVLLLLKIFQNKPKKHQVVKFWLFNPIIIFTTYIFGRFDVIVIFLLLLALWAAQLGRPYRAMISLGLASLLRLYPVILVLPFALMLNQERRQRIQLFFLGLVPLAVSVVAQAFNTQKFTLTKQISEMVHLSYPFAMRFSLNITPYDNLYIFVFGYSLIIFYILIKAKTGFQNLLNFSLYIMLLFFATSFFHPHYFSWLLPFLLFFIQDRLILNFHWVQVAGWLVYTFQWGRALAAYLIAPLSPAFFWSLPAPIELIDKLFPADQVIGMGRTVFSASCLVIAYLVYKQSQQTQVSLESAEKNEVLFEAKS